MGSHRVGHDWSDLAAAAVYISSVQLLSRVRLFATLWTAARQASLSITNSQSLLKLMSIESVTPSNHLILCHPLLLLLSSFPASRSFPMSQFLVSGGQSTGVSVSASVLPMNIQGWSPLEWTAWISLQSKGLSRVFSSTTVQRHQFFSAQPFYCPALTSVHDYWKNHQFSSVQSHSRVWLFVTPWTAVCQASLSITNSQSLLKLMSIELVLPSNHFILGRPLLLLPSIFPSIRDFCNESVLHIQWPKYWSLSFSISPSKEYSGLISFRID